ncbi:hypothetical protein MLD38_023054 [Melastoma candidum]|uniref:Uncharacterized protein n=1 Tax=Melastoma candidum TaxID=119954 RepID=A0ACB9QKL6_9MYRT|nr:hypothetical protein MLD38_023054 [Melastoma candidum]
MCAVAALDLSSLDRKDFVVVPLIWDFLLTVAFALGFVAARFFLDKFVFRVIFQDSCSQSVLFIGLDALRGRKCSFSS